MFLLGHDFFSVYNIDVFVTMIGMNEVYLICHHPSRNHRVWTTSWKCFGMADQASLAANSK